MRLLFVLLGAIASGPLTQAQPAPRPVIEGVVRTAEGLPVRSGHVVLVRAAAWRLDGSDVGQDSTGAFRLLGAAGPDTLLFVSRYHATVRRPVVLAPGDSIRVEVVTTLRPMFQVPLVLKEPDTTHQHVHLRYRNAAARTVGLPLLRSARLPEGTREIRISNEGGYFSPDRFVRLVETGGRVRGEVITHVELSGSPAEDSLWTAWMRYSEGPRCDAIRSRSVAPESDVGHSGVTAVLACLAQFREAPDWAAVWAALEAHGVWTLPDDSALPWDSIITNDGWTLQVETHDGQAYRTYAYSNPDPHHPVWEEPRHAAAIGDVLDRQVYARLLPVGGRGRYRGHAIATAAGSALFFPCDASGPWLLTFTRRTPVKDRLERDGVLFLETEGLLDMPGRYSNHRVFLPDEHAESGEPVFERRLYALPEVEPRALVDAPHPGDCAASR